MNVLWEAEEELNLSQIVQRAEGKHLRGWKEDQVERIINNIIKKGAVESYQAGHEVKYRAKLKREDCIQSRFTGVGRQVFKTAVLDNIAALTTEDELTKEEYDELQKMIDELDDSG